MIYIVRFIPKLPVDHNYLFVWDQVNFIVVPGVFLRYLVVEFRVSRYQVKFSILLFLGSIKISVSNESIKHVRPVPACLSV